MKVIVIDDSPEIAEVVSLCFQLRWSGAEVVSASDGAKGLELIETENPDVVILDVGLPEMDGFQVLREIRGFSRVPVIMLTVRDEDVDVARGLELGADDYITKPFDWRELAARIHSKLRVKQAEDILRQRTRELGVLPEIGQELSRRVDLDELAKIVLHHIVDVLEANSARLIIFTSDGRVFSRERLAGENNLISVEETRGSINGYGVVEYVMESKKGVVIENTLIDQVWKDTERKIGSAVAVPLLSHDNVIGVLTLTNNHPAFFTSDHLVLLQAIASQAAIAVENAQLSNIEHRRAQELTAINRINQMINRFSQKDQMLERLPSLVHEELGYPVVATWNGIVGGEESIELYSLVGRLEPEARDTIVSIAQQAGVTGTLVVSSDPNKEPSIIAVPLQLNEGTSYGILTVFSVTPGYFQEADCLLLEVLATQVAAALEKVDLLESIEREQRRLLVIMRNSIDAILIMDDQLRLTLANPAGEQLLGDVDSRVGLPLPAESGYDDLIHLLKRSREEGTQQQCEIVWQDLRKFWVHVTPIEAGGQVIILHQIK